jgi:uncharacterized membrane protein YhaH (DUF805 family)
LAKGLDEARHRFVRRLCTVSVAARLCYHQAAKHEQGGIMGFSEAIKAGFSNYVNFSDRACRSEYWYWVLFAIIGAIVTYIIDLVIGIHVTNPLFNLAIFLPGLAVAVRRLHDLDRSGWWILLFLIPLIGAIILVVWFCSKGTEGPNRFGSERLTGLGQISGHAAI